MTARRAFTVLELLVAMAILVVLMATCLKWFTATASQRRAAQWRQTALREAANQMERLAAQSWEELSSERAAKLVLSEEARQVLPEAALAIQVTRPADQPDAKQLAVTVRWRPRPETPEAQVRLVAWRFRKKTGS